MRYGHEAKIQELIFTQSADAHEQKRINTETHQFLMGLLPLMDDTDIPEALYSIIVQYMGHERVCASNPTTFYQNAKFLRAFNRFFPLSNHGCYRREFRDLLESSIPELGAKIHSEIHHECEVAISYRLVNGDEKPGYIISKDGSELLTVFDRYYDHALYRVPNGIRKIAQCCFTSPGFWEGAEIQFVSIPASVEEIAPNFSDPMHKIKGLHLQTNEEHAFNRIKGALPDSYRGSVISNTVYDFLTKWMRSHVGDMIPLELLRCFSNIGLTPDLYFIVLCYVTDPLCISTLLSKMPDSVTCFNPDQKALDEYRTLLDQGLVLKSRERDALPEPVAHLEEPVPQENNQTLDQKNQQNQQLGGNVGLFSSNAPVESLGLTRQGIEYDKNDFINRFRTHYCPSFYSTQWGPNLEVLQQSDDPRALAIDHAEHGGTQTRRALIAMGEWPQENNEGQATPSKCLMM